MIGEIVLRFLPHADFEAVVGDLSNDLIFSSGFHANCDEHPVSILQIIPHVELAETSVLYAAAFLAHTVALNDLYREIAQS